MECVYYCINMHIIFPAVPEVPHVNDTVVGDPLLTVPLPSIQDLGIGIDSASLCFEIHGERDKYFNLVTDKCVSVNAHYFTVTDYLNGINIIAVRAVNNNGQCKNISVNLQGCSASVDGVVLTTNYRSHGIFVRRYPDRVRISVPNCNLSSTLVMWAICQNNTLTDPFTEEQFAARMIKFVIARGLNLNESCHGLLGRYFHSSATTNCLYVFYHTQVSFGIFQFKFLRLKAAFGKVLNQRTAM